MLSPSSDVTLTDLFCGAGGSSTGAAMVPGVRVRAAGNHWDRAVEVHNANHPDADHHCADLSQVHPRLFPRTTIGWFSPECTNHSGAKGKKRVTSQPDLFGETLPDAAAERSRATMWDVVRFSEVHQYDAVIVENVVEAARWLPFGGWLASMHSLGYEHHIVYLNSMHAQAHGLPAPQSRDRMYVVFWKKGARRPNFERIQRPQAFCDRCGEIVEALQTWKRTDREPWGRYRSQYYYRCPKHSCRGNVVEPGYLPASVAIDWTLKGTRIGDRVKDLAPKTRARIATGIARHWHNDALRSLAVPVEGRDGKEARPTVLPMRTQTTRLETALVMTNNHHNRSRKVSESLPTLTTATTQALLEHPSVANVIVDGQVPFVAELRGGGSTARPVSDPMCTVTASGNHHALITPAGGTWNDSATPADQPMRSLTTRDAYGLVTPYFGTAESAKPTSDPMGTLTTVDRYALIMRNNTGGAEMTTPASEVMRTLTTGGHQSLITPGDMAAAEAQVDDCLFRMFEPHEVAGGMAFPISYQWAGTRRERVRMAGNAVTPPAARDLIACVAEAITGDSIYTDFYADGLLAA